MMQLRPALRRTHTRIAVIAVAVAGILLLTAGWTALRSITQDNMDLMARSLVYNVEAALVFGDKSDAADSVARMVRNEGVAQATVRDAKGNVFVQWQAPNLLPCDCTAGLVKVLGLHPVQREILSYGAVIGHVELRSNGQRMLAFLLWGLAALVACMGASVIVGHVVSRRMHGSIVAPLQELARVAKAVHRERAMGQRVAPADIAELRELGEHFNALLDELEARQLLLQQENMELEGKAYHDGLTGAFNRVYFEQRLMAALRQATQTNGRLALLFMDLNHFKAVNDNHGHATGDVLLQAVVKRIQSQVRDADLVARLGGDEFVVLLLEPHGLEFVQQVVDKIQDAVEQPLRCEPDVVLHPSVSIGVALFPEHGHTVESLMATADAAMYVVKQQSRTRASKASTNPM